MISRHLLLRLLAGSAMTVTLAGCNDENKAERRPVLPKAAVGAQTLHPQEVALKVEVPGRIGASVVADVRPRVGGVVRSRNFEEGTDVKTGDILYELDAAPFEASYRNAEAALKRANGVIPGLRSRLERSRNLEIRNAVSRQDLDDAQSALLQAEADVAAATAALETARINLEYTRIRAPIDGRIDASSVTAGALVTADQASPMATIRQLDEINVDVVRSSADLLRLRKAFDAKQIRTSGEQFAAELILEDGSRYPHTGRLKFSESSVSPTAGTVVVRATFPNPERMLMPGMYVRAVIEEGVRENAFLVPQRAVSRNPQGEAVAKFVGASDKIEERILRVDRDLANSWIVTEGVQPGDRLVVDGLQRAQNGQQVSVTAVRIDERTGAVVAIGGEEDTPPASPENAAQLSSNASGTLTR